MAWDASFLDRVLVPLGMILLVAYHVHLWFLVKFHPDRTVIGVNHLNRQAWVNNIMRVRTALSAYPFNGRVHLQINVTKKTTRL